jgi:hypothetical protein
MMVLLSIGISFGALWQEQYRTQEEAQPANERA